MDIEFIEQKDRDNIFKLMELCGIDMAEAYQLYTNANNSFQGAMQMHFNEGNSQPQDLYKETYHNPISSEQTYEQHKSYGDNDQFDSLYEKFKAAKQNGIKFQDNYQVRKQSSFLGGLVPKFLKSAPENFKKQIETFMGKTCQIKFESGSLSQVLAKSDKFPIIVYIIDFTPGIKSKVEQVFRGANFVDVVNVQFRNFGFDTNYEIQKSINRFVDRKMNNNSLVVLRVNAAEEIQVIQKIPLSLSSKQIHEKLKLAKNSCISKDLDEGHLERRFQQQLMGNFDYQKPMSIAEKRKIAQDRQIRKKQQQQFFASMKADQQKQRKKSQNMDFPLEDKKGNVNKNVPQPPKRNITQQRSQIRNKLRVYTEGVNIKLRVPSGQALILVIGQDEKVKYLYDYVQSIDKDIGFQKDTDRKFNIIRPYDKLNLSQHMNKTLRQVFEGSDSQNLVVSQSD